ncbi:MAG: hypothetical protein HY754_07740 [Nitrospirae bacterium]|nr:hypothetical protein [Nitrospirota bacterium]
MRTVEYSIASLDNMRLEAIKDRKTLMAEKASLLSLQSIRNMQEGKSNLVFPDRVKVIYVKREGQSIPFRASLKGRRFR